MRFPATFDFITGALSNPVHKDDARMEEMTVVAATASSASSRT